MKELITSIQELQEIIDSRKKELMEIPSMQEEIIPCIKISVPIKYDETFKEYFFDS